MSNQDESVELPPDQADKKNETINFEQELDALSIDAEKFGLVSQKIEHFRGLVDNNFPGDDQEKLNKTLLLMLELHKDQKDRPDGMPYISHPLEVSRTVVEDFNIKDVELVESSLLHDSVEDQGLKIGEPELSEKYGDLVKTEDFEDDNKDEIRQLALTKITAKYGQRVGNIIDKLSSPDFNVLAAQDTDPQDKERFANRKNELYKEHVKEAIEDSDVLVIKLADFLHNVIDAGQLPESPQKAKYVAKYSPVVEVFINRLQNKDLPCPIQDTEKVITKLQESWSNLNK